MNHPSPESRLQARIGVVIPCFKVKSHLETVIRAIGPEVECIFVVDDCCPEGSGRAVERLVHDARLRVLTHSVNQGVGGAVLTGYQAAIESGMDIIVKIDGDGQMDPTLIPLFVDPLINGQADYAKGNRFYDLELVKAMPKIRLFGNAGLSFLTKLSSGYWNIFDPTNGYTALRSEVARHLPLQKLSRRYFFETDMLFRLNTLRAVVIDIPMEAQYGDEVSNLKISRVLPEFAIKNAQNTFKRIFYNYYLRDLSVASLELPLGLCLLAFGAVFGGYHWLQSAQTGLLTPTGTIMIAAVSVLLGIQFILAFLASDIASVPTRPVAPLLKRRLPLQKNSKTLHTKATS